MVYGDLGRYPFFVNLCIRAVKYWFKLLQMKENRLPKQAYHMQINMETNGKCCWASRLRDLLCKFGFGFVWLQKSVGNERAFLALLKERLCDGFKQGWTTALNTVRDFLCMHHSNPTNSQRITLTLFKINVLEMPS